MVVSSVQCKPPVSQIQIGSNPNHKWDPEIFSSDSPFCIYLTVKKNYLAIFLKPKRVNSRTRVLNDRKAVSGSASTWTGSATVD